ncbi:MAG: glycosyltransferase family 4 protein [Candidatus Eremiobacteraeota bacterium]|nr:glycosyltransferase family 4 protein [Candidatus Eremiobacteraeota bacterium]
MSGTRTICEVIDYWGETGGSFIPAMTALASAIRKRGERYVVISTDVPGASWYNDLIEAGAELRLIHDASEVAPNLKAIRPDIIHSHFTKYDVAVARSAFRSKVLWHVHSTRGASSTVEELRARVKYMVIGAGIRQWVCVSNGIASQVLERGAPKSRVRVVPNGIDTTRFRPPTASEREAARAQFGIAETDRVILFFDRTAIKGGRVVREALERLPGYRLLVNGGPQEDWQSFARRYDVVLSPRLADPRPLYWAADAFVLASFGEGFAYVLAEAAASGLPVATSDIAPAREMVGGVDGAFMFPPGDAQALSESISRAIDHGPSDALAERIATFFSLDRWTSDMLSVYDAV